MRLSAFHARNQRAGAGLLSRLVHARLCVHALKLCAAALHTLAGEPRRAAGKSVGQVPVPAEAIRQVHKGTPVRCVSQQLLMLKQCLAVVSNGPAPACPCGSQVG